MGHCVEYIKADQNADRNGILADIENYCEQACWQEGGSYSGSLYRKDHWHDVRIYDSEDDAYEAIRRLDKGFYDDHAVLFRDTSALENAKTRKIAEQIVATKAKKFDYVENNHVASRKSAYIGCPDCGSKLSREHLRGDYCPLCRTDLRSETVRKRIEGFDEKIAELEIKLADEKKKLAAKAPVMWLVKYEYHM